MSQITLPEVLTIDEVAEYLRLPQEAVIRQTLLGNIPGQKIENNWRFLSIFVSESGYLG